jgi:hypothetical protein
MPDFHFHLTALKDRVDEVVGVLPGSSVLRVDEEDEVAEAQVPEENADGFHRFPVAKQKQKWNCIELY